LETNQNSNEDQQPPSSIVPEIATSPEDKASETVTTFPVTRDATTDTDQSSTTVTDQNQLQTDSMEIHKHPHHVMHSKKWHEYLLEFFMLFLAVFLGFVAENIREHIAEHEREKKFASHLLSDLKQDTAFFQSNIQEFTQRQKDQAYFFKILSGTTKATDSTVIVSFWPLFHSWDPKFTTGTYNQMKMSGSLRYIRNDELTSELQKYYDVLLPQIEREVTDIRKVFTDRIAPYMIRHFRFQELADSVPSRYVIVNRTNESDQELINTMGVYGGGWDRVFELHQSYLKQAQKLIRMIKEDYHSD